MNILTAKSLEQFQKKLINMYSFTAQRYVNHFFSLLKNSPDKAAYIDLFCGRAVNIIHPDGSIKSGQYDPATIYRNFCLTYDPSNSFKMKLNDLLISNSEVLLDVMTSGYVVENNHEPTILGVDAQLAYIGRLMANNKRKMLDYYTEHNTTLSEYLASLPNGISSDRGTETQNTVLIKFSQFLLSAAVSEASSLFQKYSRELLSLSQGSPYTGSGAISKPTLELVLGQNTVASNSEDLSRSKLRNMSNSPDGRAMTVADSMDDTTVTTTSPSARQEEGELDGSEAAQMELEQPPVEVRTAPSGMQYSGIMTALERNERNEWNGYCFDHELADGNFYLADPEGFVKEESQDSLRLFDENETLLGEHLGFNPAPALGDQMDVVRAPSKHEVTCALEDQDEVGYWMEQSFRNGWN